MTRTCQACGKSFEARSPRAKFCGASCRGKAHRGTVVLINAPSASPAAPAAPAGASGLVESTRAALVAAGRDSDPLGWGALELAETIMSAETPPAAKATLMREFRATMTEALRGAAKSSGPQQLRDELAARRAAQA